MKTGRKYVNLDTGRVANNSKSSRVRTLIASNIGVTFRKVDSPPGSGLSNC